MAGNKNKVSKVPRKSDEKILYKLKIDENTLRRRNITVPPTTYMKKIVMADKIVKEESNFPAPKINGDTTKQQKDIFQNEFPNEKDSSLNGKVFPAEEPDENVLRKAKL